MPHAKFQDHKTSDSREEDVLKVFTLYGHGGHLGRVTLTVYKLLFPLPKEAPHKIWH